MRSSRVRPCAVGNKPGTAVFGVLNINVAIVNHNQQVVCAILHCAGFHLSGGFCDNITTYFFAEPAKAMTWALGLSTICAPISAPLPT